MNARPTAAASLVRRIDLVTLQLFTAICEEGNLTRAATRQAIAPSAASRRLSNLEQSLGVQLLERHPAGMTPTQAGEALLRHAHIMLHSAESAAVEIGEYAKGGRGHIRMLANLSAIIGFLPEDLSDFFRAHELFRLDLQEQPSAMVVQGIRNGVADIGICSGETDTHGLQSFPYNQDHLVTVVREDHPLARQPSVAFVETLKFDYVALHATTSIRLTLEAAAKAAGQAIRWRVHVPSFDAIFRMVQAGVGLSVVPRRMFDVLAEGMGLVAIPLRDDWVQRQLVLIVRNAEGLTRANRLMLDHLRAPQPRRSVTKPR